MEYFASCTKLDGEVAEILQVANNRFIIRLFNLDI